ncbi:SRPBCC family protein [Mycolicibacterium sp. 050158]|uniref:SRPBCC family protein n=1 Tax=Mycolicibacterium sp. 050158 TaxID=3090602 RepID=UPI00299F2BDD|nr:SRPBCC family protein [Mycolicibacterium sp. 050158]MDX1892160.1 SRPBCC family protein [Mycolicibacterium sp. 050158]
MRYRDQPTVEVTQRVACDVATAWDRVTDIGLPARCSSELQRVEWIGAADRVRVGARFRGSNVHAAMGSWQTECEIVEVEECRRWVWNVLGGPDGPTATWGFEVEPTSDGVLIRQWARMGPGPSGLTYAITARPELEGRIVAKRLREWQENMQVNLDCVRAEFEDPALGPR